VGVDVEVAVGGSVAVNVGVTVAVGTGVVNSPLPWQASSKRRKQDIALN
jgi:hypothetical protein